MRSRIRRAVHLALGRRSAIARDVDQELAVHLELRVARLMQRGMSHDDAYAEALRRFGPLPETRDALVRVATTTGHRMALRDMLWTAVQDVRYAARQLRRSPAFTIGVVIALALGIGANATMFGIVDRLLLRPPARVADPATLGTLAVSTRSSGAEVAQHVQSYAIYRDVASATDAFAYVAPYASTEVPFGTGVGTTEISAVRTTASYFDALGTHPFAGRFFVNAETDIAPGAQVAVLGYGFWQRQFDGATDVIGRPIVLAGTKYTVIGIAPRSFTGIEPDEIDVWIPITAGMSAAELENYSRSRQSYWLFIVARVRAGVTLAAAAQRATAAIRAGEANAGITAERIARRASTARLTSVLPRDANADSPHAKVALLVTAVSFLLLLLACANVANLQLARAIRRRREIAVRAAMGASRARLVLQLSLDSMLLALLGACAALVVATWGGALIRHLLLDARLPDGAVDARMLVYTAIVALATALLTGLAPAIRATRVDLTEDLKSGSRGATRHRSPLRVALLVVQASVATIMLAGTGMFVLSLRRIDAVPLGMEPAPVAVVSLETEGTSTRDADVADALRRIEDEARRLPGVTGTASVVSLPFYTSFGARVRIPGRDSVPTTADGGPYMNAVGPQYFSVLHTRIVRGRSFGASDRAGSPAVVIVNETAARLWWPNENPIGKCMFIGADTIHCAEVVGVAENARRQRILEGETVQFFIPSGQGPKWATPRMLLVRGSGDVVRAAESLRRTLQQRVAGVPYIQVRPLLELIDPQTRSWRLGATLFGAFGALAILLALAGVYAVTSYDVTQQTPELGVRMALGAAAAQIVGLVLARGVRVVAAGVALGVVVVLAVSPAVSGLLYETSARDPFVLLGVATLLFVAALGATTVPAMRASRIDPSRVLSGE